MATYSDNPTETPSKRLIELLKEIRRENDKRDREAAQRKPQPKERGPHTGTADSRQPARKGIS
jgi:hypothetical protein